MFKLKIMRSIVLLFKLDMIHVSIKIYRFGFYILLKSSLANVTVFTICIATKSIMLVILNIKSNIFVY